MTHSMLVKSPTPLDDIFTPKEKTKKPRPPYRSDLFQQYKFPSILIARASKQIVGADGMSNSHPKNHADLAVSEKNADALKAFSQAIELVPPLDFSIVVPLEIQKKLMGIADPASESQNIVP